MVDSLTPYGHKVLDAFTEDLIQLIERYEEAHDEIVIRVDVEMFVLPKEKEALREQVLEKGCLPGARFTNIHPLIRKLIEHATEQPIEEEGR